MSEWTVTDCCLIVHRQTVTIVSVVAIGIMIATVAVVAVVGLIVQVQPAYCHQID